MFGWKPGARFAFETSHAIGRRGAVIRGLSTALTVAATLLTSTSHAAAAGLAVTSIRADFDNDGILDTVSVINDGRSSQVRVWLSHLARFRVLRVPDEVVSVVATDLNADGHVDVRASTRRTGVWVWLNQGRGQLRRVRPASATLAARHRFDGPGHSGPASVASSVGTDDPPSSSMTDFERAPYNGTQTVRAKARSPGMASPGDCSNTPPRAPPSL